MGGARLPPMRFIAILCLSFVVAVPLATGLAGAQQRYSSPVSVPVDRSERINDLFQELKRARNEAAAQRVANRIWREWFRSGSASIDFLMQRADQAMKAREFDVALDLLDQVVTLAPRYAEGWNRRATVHFMMDDYTKSMADIERTLRLEPRHFGALSGMAQIMKITGRKQMALDAYMRVLDVYPMMRGAQTEVGDLADELAGQGI
jgi:tetratricopeptide (TPR) repeat protein